MVRFFKIIFLFSTTLFLSLSESSTTNLYLYGGCTQQMYTPNSPYESNLNSLLTSLVNSATYSSYNNFTVLGSTQQDIIYGLYQCRGDLAMPDCASCVARAVTRAGDMCRDTCGGTVQLDGCLVKYDNATFLGVEDKNVLLKKCGPSVGYNPEAMGSRDAVLGGLVGLGGPFRVGGSGMVRGVAQCTGDLSFGECQDCVVEAIGRLKSDCGTADYGDLFLGKCYARYSTGGAHDTSKAHGKFGIEGEKRFALIIGLLAGAAILVILIAFLTKICRRQGK
ncbi:putative Gnk2-like domain-containing protein [Medicago truncatula]|uniref:Putative Gnk2-like domain-containing protein n=1 Tax=Medicago truncatula TaxID=3880 RepID=G7KG39_MEDTR|nr:plasmodesmata-located protein 7 [Medicago truncatula]AES99226.1 salt stress response/antifungal domain protein [Medicago truncatula]RHN56906.1 putative Gnk2-like domain-containing protein [Medicago truncatula]